MKLRIKCQMRMAVRKARIKMVMVILRDENLSTQFQVFHGFPQFFKGSISIFHGFPLPFRSTRCPVWRKPFGPAAAAQSP